MTRKLSSSCCACASCHAVWTRALVVPKESTGHMLIGDLRSALPKKCMGSSFADRKGMCPRARDWLQGHKYITPPPSIPRCSRFLENFLPFLGGDPQKTDSFHSGCSSKANFALLLFLSSPSLDSRSTCLIQVYRLLRKGELSASLIRKPNCQIGPRNVSCTD